MSFGNFQRKIQDVQKEIDEKIRLEISKSVNKEFDETKTKIASKVEEILNKDKTENNLLLVEQLNQYSEGIQRQQDLFNQRIGIEEPKPKPKPKTEEPKSESKTNFLLFIGIGLLLLGIAGKVKV